MKQYSIYSPVINKHCYPSFIQFKGKGRSNAQGLYYIVTIDAIGNCENIFNVVDGYRGGRQRIVVNINNMIYNIDDYLVNRRKTYQYGTKSVSFELIARNVRVSYNEDYEEDVYLE